jgi:hypothetical protein
VGIRSFLKEEQLTKTNRQVSITDREMCFFMVLNAVIISKLKVVAVES